MWEKLNILRVEFLNAINLTETLENPKIFRKFICRQQIKFYESELEKNRKCQRGFTLLF